MNIKKIIMTGPIYNEFKHFLTESDTNKEYRFLQEAEVTEEDFNWADAYVGFKPTSNFHFGNLKWVHSIGAGVDGFLFNREWDKSVVLTRTVSSFGQRIGEYCLSYMLKHLQHHDTFSKQQASKTWDPVEPILLSEQVVTVYGTGEIGQELAKRLAFFGIKVYGVSRSGKQKEHFHKVVKNEEAQQVLSGSHWVVNTLPLTADTENMFNEGVFAHLKGAHFINVGRGASVDEQALIKALDQHHIRFAVLDVLSTEPLPKDSVLWQRPDVMITPHISAITTAREGADCFLQTLKAIEQDHFSIKNIVNLEQGY